MKLSAEWRSCLVLLGLGISSAGCGGSADAVWEGEDVASLEAAVSAPNDPDFKTLQWHLNNTGQGIYLKDDPVVGIKGVDLRILKAWDKTVGSSSVVVGVIEASDMDLAHEDLAGQLWVNSGEIAGNGVDDDHNGYVDDRNGFDFVDRDGFNDPGDHGTHILGTIAAKKGNGLGGSGVAPGVRVMALRATTKDSTLIEAINYAKSKGVKIINLSQGGLDYFNDAVRTKLAAETGMLFICSAGNFAGAQYNYPSSYDLPNVLSIANIDNLGRLSPNSNVGELNVDIAAPGSAIWNTIAGNAYDRETGTSQAAATVSGVAALLRSSEPSLTPTGIITRLLNTGMRFGYLNRLTKVPAIVDAEAALNDVLNVNLQATSVPGAITLTWNAVSGATRYQVERDGTMVDNGTSLTFVHNGLSAGSGHIYRVRAQVGGSYGKWSYRLLKLASREPTLETLTTPVEPQRDSAGKYRPNQNLNVPITRPGATLIRAHFSKVIVRPEDALTVVNGTSQGVYHEGLSGYSNTGFWTHWSENALSVKFVSDASGGDYGFKVDKIEYVLP